MIFFLEVVGGQGDDHKSMDQEVPGDPGQGGQGTREDHSSMVRRVPGDQDGQDRSKIQDPRSAGFLNAMGEQLNKKGRVPLTKKNQ